MSTTALAISTAAQAQANLAQAEASRARTLACKTLMQTFESNTASVDLRQDYASCVHRLYPEGDGDPAVALSLAVSLVIAAALFVVYWVKEELFSGVVAGILGFAGTWVAVAVIVGAAWAFKVLT